jgi:hypothetical protein
LPRSNQKNSVLTRLAEIEIVYGKNRANIAPSFLAESSPKPDGLTLPKNFGGAHIVAFKILLVHFVSSGELTTIKKSRSSVDIS